MKLKKILLTGTTGFIGSYILKILLNQNFLVTDIIRKKNHQLVKLKRKYRKNYNSIKLTEIKKIRNKKFDFFIHMATYYKSNYRINEIDNLIESNIFFPLKILKILNSKNLNFINFGSMMEFTNKTRNPQNMYAATKILFEEISKNFSIKKNYNLKIFETYDSKDNRPKIIPKLIQSYKKNEQFNLYDKNLKLNFISREKIGQIISKIINDKMKPGTYILKNKSNTNIYNLIKKLNSNLNNKIKVNIDRKNTKIKPKIKIINFKYNLFNTIKNEF